ncbi:hypothetical protein IIG_01782 [Bacillus cereus VD048]|uniref:Uncharacterized protein n=1 Tax=Bacillus cereus VD048 TaxID=1053226 RepID=J8I5P8_BACCE|nr:hypothetical protein IIG_01782 [Bacillus cereus VD048]
MTSPFTYISFIQNKKITLQFYLFFKTLQQKRLIGTDYIDLLGNIDSMKQYRFSLILDDLKAAKES